MVRYLDGVAQVVGARQVLGRTEKFEVACRRPMPLSSFVSPILSI